MSFPTDNLRSPAAIARFLLTTIIGLALDLWTKHLAFVRLASGTPFRALGEDGRTRWVVRTRPDLAATDRFVAVISNQLP